MLRMSNPYGPLHAHIGSQGDISTMVNNYRAKKGVELYGSGKVVRDYIYITDVANAWFKAISSGRTGIFNLGSELVIL